MGPRDMARCYPVRTLTGNWTDPETRIEVQSSHCVLLQRCRVSVCICAAYHADARYMYTELLERYENQIYPRTPVALQRVVMPGRETQYQNRDTVPEVRHETA